MDFRFYLHVFMVMFIFLMTVVTGPLNTDLSSLIEIMNLTDAANGPKDWCTLKKQPLDHNTYESKCFSKCSCEPECVDKQTCCLDYHLAKYLDGAQFNNIHELEQALNGISIGNNSADVAYNVEANTTTQCLPAQLFGFHLSTPKPPMYEMVTRCPSSYPHGYTRDKCETPLSNMEHIALVDLVPVQALGDGKVYRNKHCQECSGGSNDDIVIWDIYLTSVEYPVSLLVNIIPTTDILLKKLLNITDGKNYRIYDILFESQYLTTRNSPKVCVQVDVKSCSQGNMTESNKHVECPKHTLPVYYIIDDNIVVFKNIICLVCNGYNVLENQKTCGRFSPWYLKPFKGKLNDAFFETKTGNDGNDSYELQESFSMECKPGYAFDSLMKTCRKLFCPCGMTSHHGQCVPIVTHIRDQMYELIVIVSVNEHVDEEGQFNIAVRVKLFIYSVIENTSYTIVSLDVAHLMLTSSQINKYAVNMIFNDSSSNSTFLDTLSFVNIKFRSKKEIQEFMKSHNIFIEISDTFKRHGYRSMVDIVEGHVYHMIQELKVLPDEDVAGRDRIFLFEYYFCYLIKLSPQEYEKASRLMVVIKRNRQKVIYSRHINDDIQKELVTCANKVLGNHIKQRIPLLDDDIHVHAGGAPILTTMDIVLFTLVVCLILS